MSVFETFYEKDWGQEARAARDERHRVLASVHGIGVVVKGTVDHRVFGRGYEVFRFSRVNEADIRVTPNGVRIQKLPPVLVKTEEEWVAEPHFGETVQWL